MTGQRKIIMNDRLLEVLLRARDGNRDGYPGTTELFEREYHCGGQTKVDYLYKRGALAREGGRLLITAKGRAALAEYVTEGPLKGVREVRIASIPYRKPARRGGKSRLAGEEFPD